MQRKQLTVKKKEMVPLTHEENNFYHEQEICYICNEKFCMDKDQVKDHCHYTGNFRGAGHGICNLNYNVQNQIPIIIHNASYDTHFLLNQLAIEFKGELNCVGYNMKKYITFSVPIKKECNNNNNNNKAITYKLKFIDSFRFMPTSLSEPVDNTSGIFNSIECKSCIEKIETNSGCCFVGLKNNKFIYKCKEWNKEWKRPLNKLIENFPNTYKFCNGDLNKFVMFLRKGVFPYKYMNGWEKFDETALLPKKDFYSNLNLEDISDEDYLHTQKVRDVFKI